MLHMWENKMRYEEAKTIRNNSYEEWNWAHKASEDLLFASVSKNPK